ncbi:transporter substrate-binding domain-containing protein [Gilvimarinus xylanilyticus]|uniref:Transporter substrate-binding domain-containing protein n=1 Tax=Gilvimarinus xylanilyticus TaxID=2944139 RepID=A0A9X2I4U2_9GAMM|nr:transporter substrate-binding domain-containing protein [Gilvimarinus xylanilyticus]MCP8899467.1 transporter substrate-binding domain-containing protein [Gilvimarinus xylanilyticus]
MTSVAKIFTGLCLLVASLFTLQAQADTLDKVLDKETLRVGVALFTPWTIKNEKGELSGFDADIARKLAADMGVKPEIKVYEWDDIMPALNKGEIDVIAAGLAVTPKRALRLEFSQPYSESGVGLATHTDKTKHIRSLTELNHKDITIAVVNDSIGASLAPSVFTQANIQTFDTADKAEKAILEGKAHGYVASQAVVRFFAMDNSDTIDVPLPEPLLSYKVSFGVRKGDQALLNFLNAWVMARTADRWLPATQDYWFDSLEWREAQ